MIARGLGQAGGELFQPIFIDSRQGQGKGKGYRSCAHGSQVADSNGKRTVGDVGRQVLIGEMHALNQAVSGDDPLFFRVGAEQGGIIADAQGDPTLIPRRLQGWRAKESADNIELTQGHGNCLPSAVLSGRDGPH